MESMQKRTTFKQSSERQGIAKTPFFGMIQFSRYFYIYREIDRATVLIAAYFI